MIISYISFQFLRNVLRSAHQNSTKAALLREEIEDALIAHGNQFMLISIHTAIETTRDHLRKKHIVTAKLGYLLKISIEKS